MSADILLEIKKQIAESVAVKNRLLRQAVTLKQLADMAAAAVEIFRRGGKLLIAGNGGSAADAQHVAGELVGRFLRERAALPALALSVNSSVLTAVANDYDFEKVFARQVEAHGRRGDMLLGISTSGNSANVICAIKAARRLGLVTAGLTGAGGGKMVRLCDFCICVPAKQTPRIQECHILLAHIFCDLVESAICSGVQA